jgi:hypothetical protein
MGVSGRQVSFTMDGDSFRAFIEQARAALSEDKGE